MVASAGGGGEGEFGGGGGGVAGAVVGPGFDDEHYGVVDRTAPGVALAVWVALLFAGVGGGAAGPAGGGGVGGGVVGGRWRGGPSACAHWHSRVRAELSFPPPSSQAVAIIAR